MALNSRQRSSSSGSERGARGLGEGASRYESRTIRDIRLESEQERRRQRMQERRENNREEQKRSKLPFIVAGVVVFLIAAFISMYYILANTNIFEIEEIEIEGTEHLTSQEVSALVTIPQGTTLLNVDDEAITTSLERDAWVKSADVQKIFPHKLKVVVHEREIGAVVEVTTGTNQTIQNWAISDDGMWLMAIPSRSSEVGSQLAEQIYTDANEALHIVGVPYGLEPAIGEFCTDENVNNALKIISDMTTDLANQLKVVKATDAESTQLTLDNNVEIAFGTADNVRDKERICLQIMEDNPNVVYINVRVPDRPTWRSY